MKRTSGRPPKKFFYCVICKCRSRLKPGITDLDDLKKRRLGRDIGCDCGDYDELVVADQNQVKGLSSGDEWFSGLGADVTPDDLERYFKDNFKSQQVFEGREVLRPSIELMTILKRINESLFEWRRWFESAVHENRKKTIRNQFDSSERILSSMLRSGVPPIKKSVQHRMNFEVIEGGGA